MKTLKERLTDWLRSYHEKEGDFEGEGFCGCETCEGLQKLLPDLLKAAEWWDKQPPSEKLLESKISAERVMGQNLKNMETL